MHQKAKQTVSEKILVVEDSPVNRKILENLLNKEGFEAVVLYNGLEALMYLQDQNNELPDLILLDILMPKMDGLTLCRHLKRGGILSNIPVIFISSLDETGDKVKGFEVGGVDYITKPFHAREVVARIQTHLKLRRLQRQVEERNRQLQKEKLRSEALLRNVLPARVAEGLMDDGYFAPQLYKDVTVCFIDIVQFTAAASRLSPDVIIRELNELFSEFDHIAKSHFCERIKTVGDAYLCTCGLPEPNPQHAEKIADAALDMIAFLHERNQDAEHKWQVRIGMHTGELVGGIVGVQKYLYDVFGDTVNIAARMESHSAPMKINVSHQVFLLLKDLFFFSSPEKINVKGKGIRSAYFLEGRIEK